MSAIPKKNIKRENLKGLIKRLEDLHEEIAPAEKKGEEESNDDNFTKLKKKAHKLNKEIRATIAERDELGSGAAGGHQSVLLSARVRELLVEFKETHKAMQAQVRKDEKALQKGKAKNGITEEVLAERTDIIDNTGKHIAECEQRERKRFQSKGQQMWSKAGVQMDEIKRSAEASDLRPIDIDPEVGEGLQQLKANDQKLDDKLQEISVAMKVVKGVAVDQCNELKLQETMIEELGNNMDKATDSLNKVNVRLKETLDQAGGATAIFVKVILLILLLSVGAYLYKMFG